MDNAILVLQILMWILCPAVIGLILLQGAAGDLTSSFGGGGQLDASLGVGAHRKMAQVTGVLAVVFFVIVLVLAYPHRKSFRDMKNAEPVPAAVTPAPAIPAAAAPVVAPAAPAAPAVTPTPVAETPAAAAPVAPAPAPAPAPAVEPAAVAPAATPAPAQPEAPTPAKP